MSVKEEKIAPYQLTIVVTGLLIGSGIVMNPAYSYGADAWYGTLVSLITGLILGGMSSAIAMLHPGKALIQILVDCFGKRAGKALGFGYMLLSLWLTAVTILDFSLYSNTTSYPETPLVFTSICYILLIAFVVRIGVEVMARVGEVVTIVFFLVTFVTFATLYTSFNADAFMPMFKNGFLQTTLKGMRGALIPYSEIFLAINIFPNINRKDKIASSVSWAVLIGGFSFVLFALRNVSVLGVHTAANTVYPSAEVFRLMPGVNVIPLLDINVIVSGVLKGAVALYAYVKMLADIFDIKNYKSLVWPSAVLAVSMSTTLHHNIMTALTEANNVVPLLFFSVLVVIPFVVLVVSIVKKNKILTEPVTPG